jgi:hypothetical protein
VSTNLWVRATTTALFVALALPARAEAVPAFARQTGMSCSACHYQHFPTLTAYGQSFKAGNYSQVGGQSLVEGDILSLPAVLNLSMILKMKYVKTSGTSESGEDAGEFMMPDEASIFLGGRVGSNMGFLIEGQLADESSPVFASFKVPLGVSGSAGRFSVIPFATRELGTPFGFELLSTGAVRNVRSFEERAATSAQQYVVGGTDEGVAEGVAFVYARGMGFANFTFWTPNHGTVSLKRPTQYLRVAVTPTVGGWQLGGGMQRWWGTSATVNQATEALAFDLQAHGDVANLPLGVYLSYARAPGTKAGVTNFFNEMPHAQWALSAAAELGFIPRRLMLGIGVRDARNGVAPLPVPGWPPQLAPAQQTIDRDVDRAFTVSATVLLAQNVELHASQSRFWGNAWSGRADRDKVSLTLFAAF